MSINGRADRSGHRDHELKCTSVPTARQKIRPNKNTRNATYKGKTRNVWKLKLGGHYVIPVAVQPVRLILQGVQRVGDLCRLQEDVLELTEKEYNVNLIVLFQ